MRRTLLTLGMLAVAGILLGWPGMAQAQDKKPTTIQIDVSKLPPDLAKRLADELAKAQAPVKKPVAAAPAAPDKKKAAEAPTKGKADEPPTKGKAPTADKKKKAAEAPTKGAAPAVKTPAAPPAVKAPAAQTSDLEKRLDQILKDVEKLRTEIRKK